MSDVTRVLEAVARGDPTAADDLLPLVYQELRKLAAHKMAGQVPGHTLQPTALVHEAWLRLAGREPGRFAGRAHFFAAAAEAMRHILIDSARRKRAVRHGGGRERVEMGEVVDIATAADDAELLAVNDVLDKLAAEDPKKRSWPSCAISSALHFRKRQTFSASRWPRPNGTGLTRALFFTRKYKQTGRSNGSGRAAAPEFRKPKNR